MEPSTPAGFDGCLGRHAWSPRVSGFGRALFWGAGIAGVDVIRSAGRVFSNAFEE
jgi:hypothetical protein